MKVPLDWLQEFVQIDLDSAELASIMTLGGLEVESVRTPGADVAGVRVARVLDVRDHPDADRLIVVTVEDGDGERIVCAGARNIRVDDLVPLAAPGATLPDGDGGIATIERREMRGVTSDGMLCSPRELQVADDHSGILVFEPRAGVPGDDVRTVLHLGSPVLDVAVAADRGDLQSIRGIARELTAVLDVSLIPRDPPAVTGALGDVPVQVEAVDGCHRYIGWVVEDVEVGTAPWWLRRRLELCGVRSLSNIVDVTNYVMLELGQPLHAFDLGVLAGPQIVVRWAIDGERLTTLDGRERELAENDLVIADAERPVALAGVMGGEDSEVGPETSRLLLEAASFDPGAVRRVGRRLGLSSEASARFERGIDPDALWEAAARAVELLRDVAGGRDAGLRVAGPGSPPRGTVRVDPGWVGSFLGTPELDGSIQAALLARAGVDTEVDGDALHVSPPSWRHDLQRPADVAEEVARLYGYERIPATVPSLAIRGGRDLRQQIEQDVRRAALAMGFHEVHTTPYVDEDAPVLLSASDARPVRLLNPIQKDAAYLRASLASGLLSVARRNHGRVRPGLALFEVGRIFRAHGSSFDELLDRADGVAWAHPDERPLPSQPVSLGLLAYGARGGPGWVDREATWELADLLAVLDEVAARCAADPSSPEARLQRRPADREHLHPGRTAVLCRGDAEIGVAGQLHPSLAAELDLPEPTLIAELLLDPLWAHLARGVSPAVQAPRLVRHPPVSVDVAVVVEDDVPFRVVAAAVEVAAGDLLEELSWFDEYRGPQLGEHRRSLGFNLRLQHPSRQLTDADADDVIERVGAAVERVGGTLRRG